MTNTNILVIYLLSYLLMLVMPLLSLRDTACCDKRLTNGAGDVVLVFGIEKERFFRTLICETKIL